MAATQGGSAPTSSSGGDLGPGLLAANWTEAGIAVVIVGLRFVTRIKVVRNVGADDYIMGFALVCSLF